MRFGNTKLSEAASILMHQRGGRFKIKYQGVKEFHMLARIGCCNFMVFSPFKVNVTYYHPLNQWLLGATNGNQGQTVMDI